MINAASKVDFQVTESIAGAHLASTAKPKQVIYEVQKFCLIYFLQRSNQLKLLAVQLIPASLFAQTK